MTPAACRPDSQSDDDYIVSFAGTDVNIDRGIVTRDGKLISLTPSEYELLVCFLMNANRELTRDAILQSVWGYLTDPNTRTVDAHVMRLRQKLEPDPERPRHFITLHKVGYRFQP
ncbi:MAG TPA: winged helix-turn-helix domain-containing protein [Bryobacteraceae bacterium]|nr:winged helix-turn-helix domain-containing protein [Bryobacteraceae bacterium]